MKKHTRSLLPLSFYLLFISTPFFAGAQEKKTLSPQELKEWNNTAAEQNILTKIPAGEKAKANDYARGILTYTIKAVLHSSDPAKYPIDEGEKSPQSIVLASLKKVSPATLTKMKNQANILLSDATKRSAILGKFKDIDFTKKSIDKDIQKITPIKPSNRPVINTNDGTSLQLIKNDYSIQHTGSTDVYNKKAFTKMDFVLRAIHCIDETSPESGDDDIIIGGLKIGCSGNTAAGKSVVSCHFDNGDYCNHGAMPLGGYNLNACTGYPKTFYFIIQLIEVDSDEGEAANALMDIMEIAAGMLGPSGYGEAVAYIAANIEALSGWLFEDDAFPPYGIVQTLTNDNNWSPSGRSANMRTGNIYGLNGKYRMGYYWQKRN